jgi:hypothetical protein
LTGFIRRYRFGRVFLVFSRLGWWIRDGIAFLFIAVCFDESAGGTKKRRPAVCAASRLLEKVRLKAAAPPLPCVLVVIVISAINLAEKLCEFELLALLGVVLQRLGHHCFFGFSPTQRAGGLDQTVVNCDHSGYFFTPNV